MTITDPVLLGPDGLRVRYLPAPPTAKQAVVLAAKNIELLVHGGGGGGKSFGLLAGAVQFADVPGYNALILRKTLTDLTVPGGLIDLSKEWMSYSPDPARYNANERKWTFDSGATLTFGYLGDRPDENVTRYRGGNWQYIGVDMADEFAGRVDDDDPDAGPVLLPSWFQFLYCRLSRPSQPHEDRSPDGTTLADVPLRYRITAGSLRAPEDPDDEMPGRLWLRHRYIDGPEPRPASISTTYRDNPAINQAVYEEQLATLTDDARRRLSEGDW